jgi:hypothetical protein
VKKYGTAGQATDASVVQRMRFACWMTKVTDTHSEYEVPIAFPRQQWLRESAQCWVIHTLPFLSSDFYQNYNRSKIFCVIYILGKLCALPV